MPYSRPGHHELREIHDWDNPLRPAIDVLELVALLFITGVSFFYALGPTYRADDGELHSVYSIFGLLTHWHTLSRLLAGLFVSSTGLLLLRDWMHGIRERKEEQSRRKRWKEDLAMIDSGDDSSH